jgi:hypothetical protein
MYGRVKCHRHLRLEGALHAPPAVALQGCACRTCINRQPTAHMGPQRCIDAHRYHQRCCTVAALVDASGMSFWLSG